MIFLTKQLVFTGIWWFYRMIVSLVPKQHQQFLTAYQQVYGRFPDPTGQLWAIPFWFQRGSWENRIRRSKAFQEQQQPVTESLLTWETHFERVEKELQKQRIDPCQDPDLVAVIVETRAHRHLSVVIQNVLNQLGHRCEVMLFGSQENKHLADELSIGYADASAVSSIQAYNDLLKSSHFWEQLSQDKVLVFQTDCFMLHGDMDPFMSFDYIGAPWNKKRLESKTQVGNGGFSLRSKQAMLDICQTYKDRWLPEDLYFSTFCRRLGYKLAPVELAQKFCAENIYAEGTLALHKPYLHLSPEELTRLLTKYQVVNRTQATS